MTQTLLPVNEIVLRDASPPQALASSRKVLHLIPALAGGGAERFLRNLVRTMHGTRWQSVVVVIRVGDHTVLAEELRAQGCIVYDLNEPALLNPGVWTGVWKLIRKEQPDVVQTWMHHADFIGGVAAWLAGVRNVVWGVRASVVWRNPKDGGFKTWLFHQALKWSSRLLPRRIIGNSQVALAAHEEMGFPPRKFVWIPNGIDAERFSPRPDVGMETRRALALPPQAPVAGFVGRFHPIKDMALFFNVAARVQTVVPDLHLVICGGGKPDLYPEAREALLRLPHPDQVHFVPFTQETERLYPAFSLLALTSTSEAFPNVVMEAMACGVPVVSTAAGDARLMIGDAGRVVNIGDADAMTQAWLDTLAMPSNERAAQVQRGRERASQEFTMGRAAERFIKVYEEVLAA